MHAMWVMGVLCLLIGVVWFPASMIVYRVWIPDAEIENWWNGFVGGSAILAIPLSAIAAAIWLFGI